MGYFDSPKNVAKWNIEMQGLRAKREDFEKNPEKRIYNANQHAPEKAVTFTNREPVTYKQLEAEERRDAQMLKNTNRGNVKNIVQNLNRRTNVKINNGRELTLKGP